LADGSVVPKDELPKNAKVKNERVLDTVTVKWCKLTGFEVLEEEEWNGKYIPLIPVVGRELQPFDEKRRWMGVIDPAKDAQRMYNYAASSAVELAALEPKAPWIGVAGQFANHEEQWKQANTRNFPYLEYDPVSVGGQPAPPPQRAQIDAGRLGPSMMLLQQADQFIQSATATFDPSLGRVMGKERSGVAIDKLQGQADAASSNFLQSLANVSMDYEATVILDLIPRIYDRPGRLTRTLSTEDKTEMVMLNMPFVMNPVTKRPTAVECVKDPKTGKYVEPLQPVRPLPPSNPQDPESGPPPIKYYDLSKGIYAVAVTVGRSRQTMMQEGADEIGQILQAQPQLLPIIGPIYFKFRDFPGSREIAELLQKMRDKDMPWLTGEGPEMSIEQAQAKIQSLTQQVQEMQQMIEQGKKMLESDQLKQQATMQTEQMKSQTTLQKAQMDNESKERIATGEQQMRIALEAMKQRMDQMEAMLQRSHEKDLEQTNAAHESALESQKSVLEILMPAPAMELPLDRQEPV
jgi:hypothetical protein